MLASLSLNTYTYTNTCRPVRHLHCRLRFVNVLTACTATTAGLPFDVTFVDVQIVSFRLL